MSPKKGTPRRASLMLPALVLGLLLLGLAAWSVRNPGPVAAALNPGDQGASSPPTAQGSVIVGHDYHHDTSPPLRNLPPLPIKPLPEKETNRNPFIPNGHKDQLDTVVQRLLAPLAMPAPILNFDGIPFPGVVCNCAPPDTNGEVGATQYVQMVNEGFQVFNKTTGASLLGPNSIASVWSGFGGVCETNGNGDPVVLYDQLANRWLISQFAGAGGAVPTSASPSPRPTTPPAAYNRYGFHLGSNFFDYPAPRRLARRLLHER